MADSNQRRIVRPLSHIEMYSCSRHALGIYRAVGVTSRYSHSRAAPVSSSIFAALAILVNQHPMLRVGIVDQHSNAASYVHIPEVDLRKHVEFRTLSGDSDGYETALAELDGWQHDQGWTQLETIPPWKVFVVQPSSPEKDAESFQDVLFSFHHALMDGVSGKLFHESLLSALNSLRPSSSTSSSSSSPPGDNLILHFPSPPVAPPSQDALVKYTVSTGFFLRAVWVEYAPSFLKPKPAPVWSGTPADYARPYKTRVLPVDLSTETASALLSACREHKVSLTSLLHALVAASMSQQQQRLLLDYHGGSNEAFTFDAITPISMRGFINDPAVAACLGVYLSVAHHKLSPSDIESLRHAADASGNNSGGGNLDELLWKLATRIRADISTRVATLPADDPAGLLKYVNDYSQYWLNKDGQPHESSWNLSNVGPLNTGNSSNKNEAVAAGGEGSGAEAEAEMYRITRVMFSNGAHLSGSAPMCINVASVPSGLLTLTITWLDGAISEDIPRALASDLAMYAERLRGTGTFAN